jgi:hypothetical protein
MKAMVKESNIVLLPEGLLFRCPSPPTSRWPAESVQGGNYCQHEAGGEFNTRDSQVPLPPC